MSLLEQVQSLTSLHQYWHSVGTPSSTAICDRLETLLTNLLQNPS